MSLLNKLFKKKPRAVAVGIDGMPHSMLLKFCESGVMPKMAALLKAGHCAKMKVTLPEISAVSWPSFMTGANPGTHGVFGFTDLKPGGYEMYFPCFSDVKTTTFWDRLGKKGKRSIVINQPGTYPAREIPGVLVSGFVAIDLVKAVRPPSWIGKIKRLNYQIDVDTQRCRKDHNFLFQDLERTLESRRAAVNALWNDEDWDFFQVVVTGTDRLQHYLWDAVEDPAHKHHQKAMDYYSAVDAFVGEMHDRYLSITGESGAGRNFFMLSDHGFCGIKQEVYLSAWLKEHGYLRFNTDAPTDPSSVSDDTKAFAMDPGRIYIHRASRFPRGKVSDDEAKELIEKLVAEIGAIEFEGKKIIQSVNRRDDIYSGPETSRGPDLVATPIDGFDLKASMSPGGLFRRTDLSGMHTWNDAFFWSAAAQKADLNITQLADIITAPLV